MAARKWLTVSEGLRLPAFATQTQTIVVYGGKDMGKTNFGSVVVEELAKHRLRFSWIDPVGVAWGLKHSKDGRGEGVHLLVLGGVHAHLPIDPEAGEVVADFVVDEDVSVIIDISRTSSGRMWSRKEKTVFVRDYMQRLYARQGERRRPILQVIDECGRFAPETSGSLKGIDHILECRAAIEEVCELGRNVGIGVLLITQRSARMAKSVSELAEMMVSFRVVGPRSIGAIVDWFGEHVEKVRQKELIERIRKLPQGTAMVVSPGWLNVEAEHQMRARETFDSSATPVAGRERRPRGRGATPDLAKYAKRMAAVKARVEADDPKELLKQIAALKRRVQELEGKPAKVEDKIVHVGPPESAFKSVDAMLEELRAEVEEISTTLNEEVPLRIKRINERSDGVRDSVQKLREAVPVKAGIATREKKLKTGGRVIAHIPEIMPTMFRPSGDLTSAEQKVVNALAWLDAARIAQPTRVQVAMVARTHPRTKSFTGALGSLNAGGYVMYPEPGTVQLTESGMAEAEAPTIPVTTESLQSMIFQQVGSSRARILQALINHYPDAVEREALAEELETHPRTKSFTGGLGALRTLGLIEYPKPGWAAASEMLFL